MNNDNQENFDNQDLEDQEQENQLNDNIVHLDDNTVVLSEEQYTDLIDTISDLQNSIDSLSVTISDYVNSSSDGAVLVPEDYYTYITDVQGQQVFFLSLLVGLVVFLLFALGLRK